MPALMKAWAVDRPGPVDGGPLVRVDKEVPQPGPGQVLVRVRVCGVCRTDLHLTEGDLAPRHPSSRRATRWSASSSSSGPAAPAGRWVTASACPGSPTPAEHAASVDRDARTSASTRASPGGTSTGAMRHTRWWTRPTPTRCPRDSATKRSRRCSAPASSATAPCSAPTSPTAAASGSTGSAPLRTSPHRSRWPGAPASTS